MGTVLSLTVKAQLALEESLEARAEFLEAMAKAYAVRSENRELRCELMEARQRFLELASQASVNPSTQGPATSGRPA